MFLDNISALIIKGEGVNVIWRDKKRIAFAMEALQGILKNEEEVQLTAQMGGREVGKRNTKGYRESILQLQGRLAARSGILG